MNKKTIITSIVISVFLIGIVSATIIPYFGKIVGSVTVSAPVFYLDGQISTGSYHKLLVDEIPNETSEVNWSDGQRIIFKTENLNLDHFYNSTFNFIFYAKANGSNRQIQMDIIKINPDDSQGGQICYSGSINITSTNDFTNYSLSCPLTGQITLNPNQGIALEIWGMGLSSLDTHSISTGHDYAHGYSRIEVTPQ